MSAFSAENISQKTLNEKRSIQVSSKNPKSQIFLLKLPKKNPRSSQDFIDETFEAITDPEKVELCSFPQVPNQFESLKLLIKNNFRPHSMLTMCLVLYEELYAHFGHLIPSKHYKANILMRPILQVRKQILKNSSHPSLFNSKA